MEPIIFRVRPIKLTFTTLIIISAGSGLVEVFIGVVSGMLSEVLFLLGVALLVHYTFLLVGTEELW